VCVGGGRGGVGGYKCDTVGTGGGEGLEASSTTLQLFASL